MQLVDRQQDHGEQADAEHDQMDHPHLPGRAWVALAQQGVKSRP